MKCHRNHFEPVNKDFEDFLKRIARLSEPSIFTLIAFSVWDQRIERGELNQEEQKMFKIKRIQSFAGF